jgi:hypothetical protein
VVDPGAQPGGVQDGGLGHELGPDALVDVQEAEDVSREVPHVDAEIDREMDNAYWRSVGTRRARLTSVAGARTVSAMGVWSIPVATGTDWTQRVFVMGEHALPPFVIGYAHTYVT